MTYIDREAIFSKDYITINEVGLLLGMGYDEAAKKIREIKRSLNASGQGVRLDVQGKLHTEDYFDFFNIKDRSRYSKPVEGSA